MKKISLKLISFYKYFFSNGLKGTFGSGCRYYPTCSDYTKEAIFKYGFFKGAPLGLKRFLRCNPFGGMGFDPVK